MCNGDVSGILGFVYDWLAILEEMSEFLEQDLDEALKVRLSKFNKSMAMRKAKMRFGANKKKNGSSNLTMAQKKQRRLAARSSAKKRTGRRVSKRQIQWR